ncbi:MAG: YkgJ family cysteine cluster protein [Bdellovibrionota bacterium]
MIDQALAQYQELRSRASAKFSEIQAAYSADMVCRQGCHACCKSGLTVNALEREELRRFLVARPSLVEELRALEAANPHRGKRCKFLGASGDCRVYEARPLVCRTHGAPLQFRPLDSRDENLRARDACPLNFTARGIGELPATSVINLDTINTLLALLCERGFPGVEERAELSVDGVLG